MHERSRITTVFVAAMVAISMVGMAGPVAAGGDAQAQDEPVYTLEDGEDLYLVFGTDLEGQSLDEFISQQVADDPSAAAESEAVADVVQYQNVNQVNINEQGGAVSIGIDNGTATAVQDVDQQNLNVQEAEAEAESRDTESRMTAFENVGDVYLVMGDDSGQQFDGWGIAQDEKGEPEVTQSATAAVFQQQDVAQMNYNEDSTAFALAVNDSQATAFQETSQSNENLQQGVANASNAYLGGGEFGDYEKAHDGKKDDGAPQSAAAYVAQEQTIEQNNVNTGVAAVAIAVGEGSTATAIQLTDQSNLNQQVGSATAANALSAKAGMNVASIGDTDAVSSHSPKKSDKDAGENEGQSATTTVAQSQGVEQLNVNLENTAMAIAVNGSEATAFQIADQENYNAQIGNAAALNVYASPGYVEESDVETRSTTVTLDGDDVDDDPGISYDYDTSAHHKNSIDQQADVTIEQYQLVTQENLNEHSAVAIAEDDGSATSTQVSLQENENVQYTSLAVSNVWVGA